MLRSVKMDLKAFREPEDLEAGLVFREDQAKEAALDQKVNLEMTPTSLIASVQFESPTRRAKRPQHPRKAQVG